MLAGWTTPDESWSASSCWGWGHWSRASASTTALPGIDPCKDKAPEMTHDLLAAGARVAHYGLRLQGPHASRRKDAPLTVGRRQVKLIERRREYW